MGSFIFFLRLHPRPPLSLAPPQKIILVRILDDHIGRLMGWLFVLFLVGGTATKISVQLPGEALASRYEPGEPLWDFQGKNPGAGLAHWRAGRHLWTNVEQDGRDFSRYSPPFIVLDSPDTKVGLDGGF
jgi:hypothetical protein